MTDWPKPPANIEPYVLALGIDGAVDVLLAHGGGYIYISGTITARARLRETLNDGEIALLRRELGTGPHKVPLASRWIAQVLVKKGLPVAQIACKLRKTETAIRDYTSHERAEVDPRQLDLFFRPE